MLSIIERLFHGSRRTYMAMAASATLVMSLLLAALVATALPMAANASASNSVSVPVGGTASITPIDTVTASVTSTVAASPSASPTASTSATPNATPSACAIRFADVPDDHTFYPHVRCLACRGSISGYECGAPGEPCDPNNTPYFRPNSHVIRGQIAKMVSQAAGFQDPPGDQIYEDVPPTSPFYEYAQRLTLRGVMSGYPCGRLEAEPCREPANRPYFRPNAFATRSQISKIVSNAAQFNETPPAQIFEDVSSESGFYVWVQRLASRGIMGGYPCGLLPEEPCVGPANRPYFRPANTTTRGQASKIVANTFYPGCQAR